MLPSNAVWVVKRRIAMLVSWMEAQDFDWTVDANFIREK